jgi:hypothetical protein
MSSAVVSTSAALGRPFLFDAEAEPDGYCHPERSGKCVKRISREVEGSLLSRDLRLAGITPASRLEIRPAPEMVTSGIPDLDALTGGLPRGCLTEICGPASSGCTSVMLAALGSATRRGEYCAVIDASDSFDPHSATAAGIDLNRLLWVRCGENSPQRDPSTSLGRKPPLLANPARGEALSFIRFSQGTVDFDGTKKQKALRSSEYRLEQVLRTTDLVLESGGFGLIILDLADIPPQSAHRIPLTTWFRFRRAVEHKPTILLAIEQRPIAGSCSSLLLQLGVLSSNQFSKDPATRDGSPSHAHLFTELKIDAVLIRSRLDRKPARSITFETKTAWAG